MVMRSLYFGPGEGHIGIIPEPLLGGIVNRLRPRYINDQSSPMLRNTDLTDPTAPARRAGYVRQTMTGATASKRIADALNFYPTSSNKYVYITQNGGGTYRNNPSSFADWTQILDAATATVDLDATTDDAILQPILDGVYVFRGLNATAMITPATDRYALDTNIDTSPPRNVISSCFAAERVFALASDGYLYYTGVNPTAASFDTDWDRASSRFRMSPHVGGKPVCVVPWKDNYLLVFYDRYIEVLAVDNSWSSLANSSRFVAEPRYGCSARRSVVVLGQQVYFLDQYGEYRALAQTINGQLAGTTALPVSESIKDLIPNSLLKTQLSKAHAIAFEDKLYLRVPVSEFSSATSECLCQAVYDTGRGVWTSWDKLQVTSGLFFTSQLRPLAEGEELWFTDGGNGATAPYAKNSQLYRMTPEAYSDADQAGALYPIPWHVETKSWDAGLPENDKILDTIEVEISGGTGIRARVDVQMDDDGIWDELTPGLTIAKADDDGYPIAYSGGDIVYPLGAGGHGATKVKISAGPQLTNHGRARTHRFRFRANDEELAVKLLRWHAEVRVLPHERGT